MVMTAALSLLPLPAQIEIPIAYLPAVERWCLLLSSLHFSVAFQLEHPCLYVPNHRFTLSHFSRLKFNSFTKKIWIKGTRFLISINLILCFYQWSSGPVFIQPHPRPVSSLQSGQCHKSHVFREIIACFQISYSVAHQTSAFCDACIR